MIGIVPLMFRMVLSSAVALSLIVEALMIYLVHRQRGGAVRNAFFRYILGFGTLYLISICAYLAIKWTI